RSLNSLGWKKLSDRALHLELDQAFQFNRIFHRKLADEVVDKAVYAQAHRLRFGQAALLHVENLFRADLTDTGLMLHRVAGAADSDRGIGVGARRGVVRRASESVLV